MSNNEWEEVYKSEYTKEVYSQNQIYSSDTGDFYVREVYFFNLGNEGVIILNSSDVKSLISTNTFENSSRNDRGGSIYIKEGQSSIRKVCSFGSKSTGTGAFCYVRSSDDPTKVNEVHDSSITYSNRGDRISSVTLALSFGNNSFFQNNITRNYGQSNTAFQIGYGQGTSSIKYSIIDENYANSRICWTGFKPTKYDSIVFTNNTVSNPDGWPSMIFCYTSDVTLENCFIANNKQNGLYLFGIGAYYGSITVSNSYIDTTELLYNPSQNVKIGPNKNVTLELHFLSTELCPGGKIFIYIEKRNKIKCTFLFIINVLENLFI